MDNTSLEKSHSKLSNLLLTLISLLLAISANATVITLALRNKIPDHWWAISFGLFGLLSLGCILLFSIFKR